MAKISNITFLPQPISSACAVTWGQHVYIFGGIDYDGNVLNTIYEYSINYNDYAILTHTLPTGIYSMRGVHVGDRIYLFGGITTLGTNNYKIYSFDETNGIVDTGFTTTFVPQEFYLDIEGRNLICLNYSVNYECVNLNADWSVQSVVQYTDTDSKLGTIHNWIDKYYYYSIKNNKIYTYEMDDTSIGDQVNEVAIPTTCGYCRQVVPYTSYSSTTKPSYLLFTKVNGSYTEFNIYRYDVENNEVVRLRYMETQINDFDYFAYCMGNIDNIVYLFGGDYQQDAPTDVSLELDFNYPEIYVSYNATYIRPSNQQHYISKGNNYNLSLSQIIINNAYENF